MAAIESVPALGGRALRVRAPASLGSAGLAACGHCGEPVAADRFESSADTQFCCDGCRIVFSMLKQHGLAGYYEHGANQPAVATGRDYAEFDDPAFLSLYARARG